QAFAAAEVGFEVALPVLLERNRYLRIAVAGQVDQATLVIQAEEIQQLGTARGVRGASQAGVSQGIQRAGLARVGATGEGNFQSLIGRALVNLGSADHESGLLAEAEDRIFREHDGSGGA